MEKKLASCNSASIQYRSSLIRIFLKVEIWQIKGINCLIFDYDWKLDKSKNSGERINQHNSSDNSNSIIKKLLWNHLQCLSFPNKAKKFWKRRPEKYADLNQDKEGDLYPIYEFFDEDLNEVFI
jgi:hypothetical protein